MPSPFPGMNPYLEHPDLWSEVHSRLIVAIADDIAPALLPNYYVAIEKRIYLHTPEDSVLIGIPDVSVISGGGRIDRRMATTPQPPPSLNPTNRKPSPYPWRRISKNAT